MFFSDIVEQLGVGTWGINEKNKLIYEISELPLKIQFFPERAKLDIGFNSFDITFSEFADISFKDEEIKKESVNNEEISFFVTSIYFKEEKLNDIPSAKVDSLKALCANLITLFDDDNECTPKFQVSSLIKEFSLNASDEFDPDMYKLLLMYKNRLEDALNIDCLHENSRILMFLEENSGKFSDNIAKNVLNIGMGALLGGVKGITDAAINVAKASVPRVANGVMKSKSESKGFMLLTDKNVILAKPDEITEYDFDDASEVFSARQDETLVGIVDIYDDCENKVLDNVAQGKWNVFKNQLRKIKKEAEQIGIEGPSMDAGDGDEFAEAEKKITKLKQMLDNGIISQEDFDAKKAEILSAL